MFLIRRLSRTAFHSVSEISKGVVFMSTYEEFMVILTVAMLMVTIMNFTHKK